MLHTLHKLLSIIKNGQQNRILVVQSYKSKNVTAVLNVLLDNGFIQGFRPSLKRKHCFDILLKYNNDKPVISSCILISKPSKRIYQPFNSLPSPSAKVLKDFSAPMKDPEKKDLRSSISKKNQWMFLKEDLPYNKDLNKGNKSHPLRTEYLLKEGSKDLRNQLRPYKYLKKDKNKYFTSPFVPNPKSFLSGIFIISTNKGIMCHNTAIKYKIGGLLLCHIA